MERLCELADDKYISADKEGCSRCKRCTGAVAVVDRTRILLAVERRGRPGVAERIDSGMD